MLSSFTWDDAKVHANNFSQYFKNIICLLKTKPIPLVDFAWRLIKPPSFIRRIRDFSLNVYRRFRLSKTFDHCNVPKLLVLMNYHLECWKTVQSSFPVLYVSSSIYHLKAVWYLVLGRLPKLCHSINLEMQTCWKIVDLYQFCRYCQSLLKKLCTSNSWIILKRISYWIIVNMVSGSIVQLN